MSTTIEFAVPSDPAHAVPADLSSARSLHQRLNTALDDLGLSEALPPRWATPARSGFFFAPHNLSQAARLVDALERIGGALSEAGIDVHGHSPADHSDGPPDRHPGVNS
jgi:hypothetical protein